MSDPVQLILASSAAAATPFAPNSRYLGIEITQMVLPGGRKVAYLRRRLVPPPERFVPIQEHVVSQGDRLGNIGGQYLGDPEQFWKICDANRGMRPDDLTAAPGRRLRITLPEGIPGTSHA
jgi:hypothetical protein